MRRSARSHRGRELGSFERAQVATSRHAPYNAVVAMRLDGSPAPAALAAALARLARRHPLVGARVEKRGRRQYFVAAAEPAALPLAVETRRDDAHWCERVETELNRGFDLSAGPLLRCALLAPVGGRGAAEIVVTMPHAIVDAAGFVTVCRELLAGLAGDRATSAVETSGLGPRPDDRFPARLRGLRRLAPMAGFLLRQLGDEVAFRWRTRGDRRPPVAARTRCRIHRMELGREETAALEARTRRERLTLSSVLNAALLEAVDRRLYGGGARALRCFVFPDLRTSLRPRVAAGQLGSFMTVVRVTAPLGDGGLWRRARRLHRPLAAALRRDERFLAALFSPWMMAFFLRQRRQRMGAAAVSYTGPTSLGGRFGRYRLVRLHAFVSNFALGPEYAAQVRRFDGRMLWDIVYLEPEMDAAEAARIADEIRGILRAAVETASR